MFPTQWPGGGHRGPVGTAVTQAWDRERLPTDSDPGPQEDEEHPKPSPGPGLPLGGVWVLGTRDTRLGFLGVLVCFLKVQVWAFWGTGLG